MKNVAVMHCYGRSWAVNDEYREQIHAEIDAWAERVDRFYLWTWYLDHWPPTSNLPIVQLHVFQKEIAWLLTHPNYGGEFIEANAFQRGPQRYATMETPGLMHLAIYLSGRLYMDPATDADELLAEYARLFYGPAEKPMLAFWTAAQRRREELCTKANDVTVEQLFTVDFLNVLNGYLESAVAVTEEGSVYRRRVALVKGEFDVGRDRIARLVGAGGRVSKLPIIEREFDLQKQDEELFCAADGSEADVPRTTVRYGRNRHSLILRFIGYEPDMRSIVVNVLNHDNANIWKDDCIEIFLYPDELGEGTGYQLSINTGSVVFDAAINKADRHATDASWESNVIVGFKRYDDHWLMDVTIPFKSLGIEDPDFAGPIAANFYRNRVRNGKAGCSVWSPTGYYVHNTPEKFGRLIP